jgi:hypothetical protein
MNFISVLLFLISGLYTAGLILLTGFKTKSDNPEDFLFHWSDLTFPVVGVLIAFVLNTIPFLNKYLK